ncbi:hypothetical protein DPMN_184592, partial [Dreissena polymorpha]
MDEGYISNQNQTCLLEVVGWRYNISEVHIGLKEEAINTEYFNTPSKWQITNTTTVIAELVEKLYDGNVLILQKLEFRLSI